MNNEQCRIIQFNDLFICEKCYDIVHEIKTDRNMKLFIFRYCENIEYDKFSVFLSDFVIIILIKTG